MTALKGTLPDWKGGWKVFSRSERDTAFESGKSVEERMYTFSDVVFGSPKQADEIALL